MGYYGGFRHPIPHLGVRSIVLLTLSPLALAGTFDLHVLAMPPAFNLSHDQTLQLISLIPSCDGVISIEEDHVTCSGSFRTFPQAVSSKRPGGHLLPLVGTSGILALLVHLTTAGLNRRCKFCTRVKPAPL